MGSNFEFKLAITDNTLMTTVRLTVGGLAAAAGLDVDGVEDFKVCVTESLLLFKRNGYTQARAKFFINEGDITGYIEAQEQSGEKEGGEIEDEISYALLGALVDEIEFERNEQQEVTAITLQKQAI